MTRFIAFVSGKGGAGKTTTAINVGHALTAQGKNVLLLDANVVTPNVGIQLGVIDPEGTVNTFLSKKSTLHQIIYAHESGISFIPASPSYVEFQKTNPQKLTEIFEHLENYADYVLVDAPGGLGYEVSNVLKNTDEALIVVNPNFSSVMDALKSIQLAKANQNIIPGIIINLSHNGRHELSQEKVEQIMGYPTIAAVRYDRKFRKAVHRHAPLSYLYPHSRAARQFQAIATFLTLQKEVS